MKSQLMSDEEVIFYEKKHKVRRELFRNAMLFAILIICFIVFSVLLSISVKMDNMMSDMTKIKESNEVIVEMGKIVKELNKRFELDNKEGVQP
jgi:hypothetical protein